jgi:hypothetical protein
VCKLADGGLILANLKNYASENSESLNKDKLKAELAALKFESDSEEQNRLRLMQSQLLRSAMFDEVAEDTATEDSNGEDSGEVKIVEKKATHKRLNQPRMPFRIGRK